MGAAGLLVGCAAKSGGTRAPTAGAVPSSSPAPPLRASKRILVLGGTGFAGPPIVEAARARGHVVTLFNRGKSDPGLFTDVETIVGDRITELDKLKGRDWDAVIDTWAPGPTLVRQATAQLADHVGQYVYLSTSRSTSWGAIRSTRRPG